MYTLNFTGHSGVVIFVHLQSGPSVPVVHLHSHVRSSFASGVTSESPPASAASESLLRAATASAFATAAFTAFIAVVNAFGTSASPSVWAAWAASAAVIASFAAVIAVMFAAVSPLCASFAFASASFAAAIASSAVTSSAAVIAASASVIASVRSSADEPPTNFLLLLLDRLVFLCKVFLLEVFLTFFLERRLELFFFDTRFEPRFDFLRKEVFRLEVLLTFLEVFLFTRAIFSYTI
jgi:hypothetical protein